jgi:hypothetical protein
LEVFTVFGGFYGGHGDKGFSVIIGFNGSHGSLLYIFSISETGYDVYQRQAGFSLTRLPG